MSDYARRREMMVDTQIRPADVTKYPLLEAMMTVPREAYVPAALREVAYLGGNLELGGDRVVLDPRSLGKMLDGLDIQPDEVVLDIGCTYGYSAAVMGRLAETVVAVEEDAAMAAEAQATLSEQSVDNAVVVEGVLAAGDSRHGPYDAIVIQGGVEDVPDTLVDQLKEGGRIAAIFMDSALGTGRIGHAAAGRVNWRYAFNAAAPVLPGFARRRAFAL